MNSVYTQDISSYQVQQYAFKTNFYQILEDENSTSCSFPMHTTGYLTTSYWIVYISYIRDLSTNYKRMNHFKKLYVFLELCVFGVQAWIYYNIIWDALYVNQKIIYKDDIKIYTKLYPYYWDTLDTLMQKTISESSTIY